MISGGGGAGKLDATVPKMFCSMIHASVLMIDPKRGSAEDENNTKDHYDPFLGVDVYDPLFSVAALSSRFPTHRAAHHPDVHRFAKKASAATSSGGGVVGGMNGSNLNKPFGPHFRRVWVQGEVTSSVNNGAVLVVSDGTGSVEVNTDGERKIEKGAYVCAMGWLSKEKKVQATHVMEIKDAKARKSRERAWAMEIRELWDGIRAGATF